jgi:8-oxo-dGTP pyrophosphatase MutT (NUDIX family)
VAAQREVQEETGLIIKNLKKIGEEIIFFASLPPGNQDWKCYFYQTKEYEGRIKNREPEKILDIKFVN